jgi:hypothetical protein
MSRICMVSGKRFNTANAGTHLSLTLTRERGVKQAAACIVELA